MILIHTCYDLYDVIVDTYQDEYKSSFIYLLGAGICG